MEAARQQQGSPATLGDVLYATPGKPRVSEEDWVALVRSIAGADQAALHALYERSHRAVFTLMMRISGNRETAEELTLDVYHDVWRRACGYDPANGTVLGWIMNQARSRAIDRLRHDQRRKRVDPYPDHAAEPDYTSQDPVELKQRALALRSALTELTADERRAIEAAFFSEMTYAEVALRLDQPLGTVKTRIRSALEKLRRVLAQKAPSR